MSKAKMYRGQSMPKGEARPLGTKPARKRARKVQKVVDTAPLLVVESFQSIDPVRQRDSPILAASTPRDIETSQKSQEQHMTLTLKNLSKNGKRAIYIGAAQSINISLGAFPDQTAPSYIEVADGVFAVKAVKTKKARLTKEERAALPKPTEAEKIARAEARLAARKAKLNEVSL